MDLLVPDEGVQQRGSGEVRVRGGTVVPPPTCGLRMCWWHSAGTIPLLLTPRGSPMTAPAGRPWRYGRKMPLGGQLALADKELVFSAGSW